MLLWLSDEGLGESVVAAASPAQIEQDGSHQCTRPVCKDVTLPGLKR